MVIEIEKNSLTRLLFFFFYFFCCLGFLTEIISTPVTSGFTSASSIIIIVSQIRHILGISYKSKNTKDDIYHLFEHFHEFRYGDTILGIFCIIILLSLRVNTF